MWLIRQGDYRVEMTVGEKKIQDEADYRLFQYASFGGNTDHFFVKNHLSGTILELDAKEYDSFMKLKDGLMSGKELRNDGLGDLVKYGIAVPLTQDDYKLFELVHLVISSQSNIKQGLKKYMILPTLGCNARCVYCYEASMSASVMDSDMAKMVVDFISRTKREGEIELIWYGGEPLVSKDIISIICKSLTERGIQFTSKMITNAVLMTKELACIAKEEWHLTKAQVSADGEKADYEARKRYCNPIRHNYDVFMQSVHNLLDAGIDVVLRCNYDEENLPGMKKFLDDVREEFHNSTHLFLYFGMLIQEQKNQKCIHTYKKMYELRRYLDETGMHYRKPPEKEYRFKKNFCMADSYGEEVVIDPDGKIFHCMSLPDHLYLGTIKDKSFQWIQPDGSKVSDMSCKKCPYLPECLPFRKNACPNWFAYCREFKDIDAEYAFERLGELMEKA